MRRRRRGSLHTRRHRRGGGGTHGHQVLQLNDTKGKIKKPAVMTPPAAEQNNNHPPTSHSTHSPYIIKGSPDPGEYELPIEEMEAGVAVVLCMVGPTLRHHAGARGARGGIGDTAFVAAHCALAYAHKKSIGLYHSQS